jgi:predicted secreted protein
LNVADAAAMLTAIKSMQPMTLMWDETATSDNQTRAKATFARKGQAFLNDVVFQFDDRTNSQKQLQFQGSGPLETVAASEVTQVIPLGSYTKGQFVRLFLGSDNTAAPSTVIAAAKSLSLHVSLTLEDATTKDTAGDWQIQEPTAISYDITTGALVRSGDTITSQVGAKALNDLETIYEAGTPVKWKIANVSGDNNRTASSTIVSGSVVLTQLTINGPNRQNADYTAQLNGYGEFTVAA